MNNNYAQQPFYNRQPMYAQPMYTQPNYTPQPNYTQQMYTPPVSQIMQTPTGIQGKSVESLEVAKVTEIPLDGSISYFPLTDGTAIVTKQLMQDGTSKTIIYKPTENEKVESTVKYITVEDLDKAIKKIDNTTLKDEIKTLKRQLKDLSEDFNEEIKNRKD